MSENWKNAPPEFKIVWDYASALIAYNVITPLYFQGAIAGSEFLTYNAGKIYIAHQMTLNGSGLNPTTFSSCVLYDNLNVSAFTYLNSSAIWDTVAATAKATLNTDSINNIYFSRITVANISQLIFRGYRLTV